MKKIKVKNVKDLGPQFVDNPHKMVGQDGAYSIPINDGKALWFFGDTLIGKRIPGESLWYPGGKPIGSQDLSGVGGFEKMLNNCGLILEQKTGKNGLKNFSYILDKNGEIKQLIPRLENEDKDEFRIWCQDGVKINDKIYLSYIKIRMLPEDIFPVTFELVGSGFAVGSEKDWNFKRVIFNNDYILWGKDEPKFASAIYFEQKENWLYLYGVLLDENKVQQCYVARIKPDDIEHIDKYEYFNSEKSVWTKNLKEAKPIFSNVPNELSFSYNKYLNCYLAIHSLDLTGKIVARTSQTPFGPWSEPIVLYEIKTNREKELPYPALTYAGKEHPELSDNDGKIIYITYIEFEEYFPHLIEVEFE